MIIKGMKQVIERRNKHKCYLVLFYNFRLARVRCIKRGDLCSSNLGSKNLTLKAEKTLKYLRDCVEITPDDWNKDDIFRRDIMHGQRLVWSDHEQEFNDLIVPDYTVERLSNYLDNIGLASYIETYNRGVPVEDLFTTCEYLDAPFPTLRTSILPGMQRSYEWYSYWKTI